MYNEELELLIDAALTDGKLTEKEKQILFKKAQAYGIDLDEFEMILDSRLQKRQQEMNINNAATSSAPKSSKFGDVRKCPSCGAVLESFITRCPECGHEFSNIEAVGSAQKLFQQLQTAAMRCTSQIQENEKERQRQLEQLSARQASTSALSKMMTKRGENDAQRQAINDAADKSRMALETNLIKERQQIIKNFPIPNTKEDLTEMLTQATSNAYDNDGVIGPEEEVWIQKCDQIYSKIKVIAAREKDQNFLSMASEMIISLMARLPKEYKNFTQIDQATKEKMLASEKANKVVKRQQAIELLKIWGTASLLSWIFLVISFVLINKYNGLGLTLLILSIIAIIFTSKIRNKKMSDAGLKWTDLF